MVIVFCGLSVTSCFFVFLNSKENDETKAYSCCNFKKDSEQLCLWVQFHSAKCKYKQIKKSDIDLKFEK